MNKRDRVYETAQKLVEIGQDPSPGTASWHEAMEKLYRELLAACAEEEGK